jgi:chaperonin GroEL
MLRAQTSLDNMDLEGDLALGAKIVRRAIEEPIRQIAENAGQDGGVVAEKVRAGEGAFGFNARTEVYEDLIAAGVIDPTKVTRCALENAASVSGLLLMTDVVIYDKATDEPMPPMPPGGMGGMGGMY